MFNFIKKILGSKKEDMITTNSPDFKYSDYKYQWKKGDRLGQVCYYDREEDSNEMKFMVFKDGTRINKAVVNEFLEILPLDSKTLDLDINQANTLNPTPQVNQQSSVNSVRVDNVDHSSPIIQLLKKQKENSVNVGVDLKINLPTKKLYNILLESYGEEAEEEILDFAVSNIDIDQIRNAVKDSIRNNFYKNGTRKASSVQ